LIYLCIMKANDGQITDYDVVLDAKFGKTGTPEREQANKDAYTFYMGQILKEARQNEKMTQAELAEKVGMNKTYISRIEKGTIEPGIATFGKIINALGLRIEIVKTLA
jgi:DNA-binding XRE family transcriptional regulator